MYKRVISLAPSNTEILFELGLGDKVVGVTNFCDYPIDTDDIEKIGSWTNLHEIKKIENLKPDLLLTSMYVPPAIKKWSEKKSVKLINLYPQTLQEIYNSILEVGTLFEKRTDALMIVNKMKRKILEYNHDKKVKIYSEEFHKPPTVGGNWVPELIEHAGGVSMGRKGILSHEVDLLDVAKFDPDIMLLHWCGFGNKSSIRMIKERKGWDELRAVKNNKVFAVDDTYLNRPGPRIWKGVELVNKIIRS